MGMRKEKRDKVFLKIIALVQQLKKRRLYIR